MTTNLFDLYGVPSIESHRNYWFVRTNSGIFYDDFVFNDYIAIAWDQISVKLFKEGGEYLIRTMIEANEKALSSKSFSDEDDDEMDPSGGAKARITAIYNKLNRFINEMKPGDIVLIPSKNSDVIKVGTITSDVYEDPSYMENYLSENPGTELTICPYAKRRKVTWLKSISKTHRDIYLTRAINSQHALSQMNEYAPYIDRAIYPIYRKNNEVHSTLHAGHPNGMNLKELAQFSNTILSLVDDISDQCGISIADDDVQVKINIHSPGLIELIGLTAGGGIAVAIILFAVNHLINGGKFNLSFTKSPTGEVNFSIGSETPGIKGSEQNDRELDLKEKEMLITLIKDMDIKNPQAIAAIANGKSITADMLAQENKPEE